MIDLSNKEQVEAKLKEFKEKDLPKMNIESFSKLSRTFANDIKFATEEERKEIEKYLSKFYDYSTSEYTNFENKCIFTGEFPDLTWGLKHGTAIDRKTGIGWVQYHYLTIKDEENKYTSSLQYHSDCYELAEGEEDDDN